MYRPPQEQLEIAKMVTLLLLVINVIVLATGNAVLIVAFIIAEIAANVVLWRHRYIRWKERRNERRGERQ
jgi:hypothetical protein